MFILMHNDPTISAVIDRGGRAGIGLMLALASGKKSGILHALDQGADINFKNKEGFTPLIVLMESVKEPRPRTIKIMLKNGADVTIQSDMGGHALAAACVRGWLPVVKLLIEANVNMIHKYIYENNNSSLLIAVMHNFLDVARLLIEHGADVNHSNTSGVTALYALCGQCMHPEPVVIEFMRYLLAHGALVDTQDVNGVTPLMIASERGKVAIVSVLIGAGADPSKADRFGQKVMHRILVYPAEPVVCELLQSILTSSKVDANVSLTNHGYTALHCAVQANQVEVCVFYYNAQTLMLTESLFLMLKVPQ
jgi:ankyrin repeat protein